MWRLVVAVLILALPVPLAGAGTAAEAHIKGGFWHGVKWELRGGAWRDGSYCVAMLVRDRENARACGNVRQQGGIGYSAGGTASNRHLPNFVMGAVVAKARSVRIEFFDRPPLRLGTIPAPRTLEGGERFFIAVLACPATPRKLIAGNAAGQVVARYAWQGSRPKSVC